jgi:tetratricopeptide (TPR) repeat protein
MSFVPGDAGKLYHRIGNCDLKLHDFQAAELAYREALEDDGYDNKTAVAVNLGKALLGAGRYADAIVAFNQALHDGTYAKSYQAYSGLGTAYSHLGDIVQAGTAYRNAALDARNPSPAKALMNLGGCFYSLDRMQDAAEVYGAVCSLDPTPDAQTMFSAREKLGQLYTALGRYQEAVAIFEQAVSDGAYALSDEAADDYKRAKSIVTGIPLADAASSAAAAVSAASVAEADQAGPADADPYDWEGEPPDADIANGAESAEAPIDAQAGLEGAAPQQQDPGATGSIPLPQDTDFFTISDEDLIAMSKSKMKSARKMRHVRLKVTIIILAIIVVLLAGAVVAFWQGFGFPSQETTINDMFAAQAAGQDTTQYWTGSDAATVQQMMNRVAATDDIDITYMATGMTHSEAMVKASLPEGGTVNYDIKLGRSLIAWKVTSIDLAFASQQQS